MAAEEEEFGAGYFGVRIQALIRSLEEGVEALLTGSSISDGGLKKVTRKLPESGKKCDDKLEQFEETAEIRVSHHQQKEISSTL